MSVQSKITTNSNLTMEVFSLCLLLVCGLQIIESLLPKIPIFPWLKLGLSYLIFLPFLLKYGVFPTLILFLSRNWLSMVYGAQPLTSFLVSSISGFLTILFTGFLILKLYEKNIIGLLGLSLSMALSFNCSQLFLVNSLFIRHGDFYFQLGPILIWSVLSGAFISILVKRLEKELVDVFTPFTTELKVTTKKTDLKIYVPIIFSIGMGIFLFINSVVWIHSITIILMLFILRKKALKIILFAWPFYFYLAWFHLFNTEGTYILKTWITQEGLDNFLIFGMRLLNIMLLGRLLANYISRIQFNFTNSLYLKGVLLTLPVLPKIFPLSIQLGKSLITWIIRPSSSGKAFQNITLKFKEELSAS